MPEVRALGISSQLCRAAVSIPCNIADGQCKSRKEFHHYVSHSRGSLQELMTLVVIAERRHYGSPDLLTQIRLRANREGRRLSGLRRSLL
jgi:four helix bundle protein